MHAQISFARRARTIAVALSFVVAGAAIIGAAPKVSKTHKVGKGLYEIAVSPSTGKVYVAAIGEMQKPGTAGILVLDPTTLEVKETIKVEEAAFGLGLNDKTQTLYTSNTRNGSVSAIDLKTSKVVATIRVAENPKAHLFRVLVDEDSNTVYVSLTEGVIWVIDGKTNTLAHTITNVGKTTMGLALDPAGQRLFAANRGSNDIAVIDVKTREITKRIPTGGEGSSHIAFDPKTQRLFVTNQTTNNVSVIDLASGKALRAIPTGTQALGIGFNPATNQVYVANRQGSNVSIFNADSLEMVATLDAGSMPNTVAIDTKTNRVYVTNKAKSGPRGSAPVEDPSGDTVTLIVP